jgi:hypothetical protein
LHEGAIAFCGWDEVVWRRLRRTLCRRELGSEIGKRWITKESEKEPIQVSSVT